MSNYPELIPIVRDVAEIWQDKKYVKFLSRFKPEVHDAFVEFLLVSDYKTMSTLEDVLMWCLEPHTPEIKALLVKIEKAQLNDLPWEDTYGWI